MLSAKIGLFRPTSFSPGTITGLAAWWDFSDASTLYSDSAATTLAAADASVAVAKDKSTNGYNIAQSTANNRPLRKTAVKNSLDVLRFNGSTNTLAIPDVSTSTWPSYSIFTVAKPASSGVYGLVDYNRSYNFGTYFNGLVYYGVHNNSQASRGTATANVFYSVYSEWSGTALRVALNGTFSGNTSTSTALSSQITSGNVGSLHGPTFYLNGDIGEIVIYKRKVTETERASVAEYLRTKWSLY
jgi:hypothetical protein